MRARQELLLDLRVPVAGVNLQSGECYKCVLIAIKYFLNCNQIFIELSSNIFPDLRGVALVAGLVEHVLVALETLQNDASVTIQNLVKINVIRQIKTISHCFCWDVDFHENIVSSLECSIELVLVHSPHSFIIFPVCN